MIEIDNAQVEKLMRVLDVSKDEAIQIIKDDKAIDSGEKLFELNAEQKQAAKKATQADRTPTLYKFDTSKKVRKEDSDKRELMKVLYESVKQVTADATVTNLEREMEFTYNERKFKIVLSAPRK